MSEIVRLGVTRRWSDVVIHDEVAYFVEVPDDPTLGPREQFLQVLAQIDERMKGFQSNRRRLLQATIFLPHLEDLPLFNELWDAWVPEGCAPSRACIHAPLAAPGYRVELVLTAAVGET